jgi:hypothetical protein
MQAATLRPERGARDRDQGVRWERKIGDRLIERPLQREQPAVHTKLREHAKPEPHRRPDRGPHAAPAPTASRRCHARLTMRRAM